MGEGDALYRFCVMVRYNIHFTKNTSREITGKNSKIGKLHHCNFHVFNKQEVVIVL